VNLQNGPINNIVMTMIICRSKTFSVSVVSPIGLMIKSATLDNPPDFCGDGFGIYPFASDLIM
jgi:hypothetical protein